MCKVTIKIVNPPLVNGYYYHVYNRGVEKRTVFGQIADYKRFLKTIEFYRLHPTPRKLSTHLSFNEPPIPENLNQKPLVNILCFCLMPNHFHLLIQQLEDRGITEFMRRVTDSYTKYFNTKNRRVGPLFQGTFKAKIIEKDEYLLQLSKYIHRNPVKLTGWKDKLSDYTFSSYPCYLDPKRNFGFCDSKFILDYFGTNNQNKSYPAFVEENENIALSEDVVIDDDY